MKTLAILILFFFCCSICSPQSWNKTYNGTLDEDDQAAQVVTDQFGNVYVTGYAHEALGGGFSAQYVTIKYDASGIQQWIAYYNGFDPNELSENRATSIAVDNTGNVYVTGFSEKRTLDDRYDIATLKYNSSGIEQWAARYEPPVLCCKAYSIAVDGDANVYVTGVQGPGGPSVCGEADLVTIKYNSNGVQQWVHIYDHAGGIDKGNQVVVGAQGNVFVAGESQRGSGLDYDFVILKYDWNSDGMPAWVVRHSGLGSGDDKAHALAGDRYGNVYVTGESIEEEDQRAITTIKYDYSGTQQWIAHYYPPVNQVAVGTSLKLFQRDCEGDVACWVWDVYVAGYSSGGFGNWDITTVKYDPSGGQLWANRYDGAMHGDDRGNSIGLDAAGNAYVTGFVTDIPISTENKDYVTLFYKSNGVEFRPPITENGGADGDDISNSISVDREGNVLITGFTYEGRTTFDNDYRTIRYGTSWDDEASGTSSDLKAVSSPSTDVTYAAGNNGVILKTSNAGLDWTTQQSNTTRNLTAISFLHPSRGIAIGDSGTVLITTNGGQTWIDRSLRLQVSLHRIYLINSVSAVIVGSGGKIFRTNNGGTTWTLQPSSISNDLYDVSFSNANTGVAIGADGRTLHTTNGGSTWISTPSFTSRSLRAVYMANLREVLVAGDSGAVYYSSNSGTSWIDRSYNTTANLTSMCFVNSHAGFVAGEGGLILFTSAKGESWSVQHNDFGVSVNGIATHDLTNGFAVGGNGAILVRKIRRAPAAGNSSFLRTNQDISRERPMDLRLWQNYPNPFNPSTVIRYQLPSDDFVVLKVYDVLGQEVATLTKEAKQTGEYAVRFDASHLPSGIYLYRLQTSRLSLTRKLMLVR
jgi:hypothetical protein